jgi:hypothetical protein
MKKLSPYGYSLNNRFILEVYKKEAPRSSQKNGFAFIDQKLRLKGLRILYGAHLTSPEQIIPAGWIAYVKEEALHTQPWAQKILECDGISQPFIIVDVVNVEFIAEAKDDHDNR